MCARYRPKGLICTSETDHWIHDRPDARALSSTRLRGCGCPRQITYILNRSCLFAKSTDVGCDQSQVHHLWSLMLTAYWGIFGIVLLRVGPRLSVSGLE